MLYFRFYFSLPDLFVSKPNKNISMVWNDHCFERMNGQAQNNIQTVQLFLLSLRRFFARKKEIHLNFFLCYYALGFSGQQVNSSSSQNLKAEIEVFLENYFQLIIAKFIEEQLCRVDRKMMFKIKLQLIHLPSLSLIKTSPTFLEIASEK